jgi:hypothetical protein
MCKNFKITHYALFIKYQQNDFKIIKKEENDIIGELILF